MINITDKEFEQLADFIKGNYGIHLSKEKKSLIEGRLQHLLMQHHVTSFSEYYDAVLADVTMGTLTAFIDKITTNHTFFMREKEHFDYFNDKVLPYLEETVKDRDLRIWSAGCATGEEAYTLAMMAADYFGRKKALWNTKILATDISSEALQTAIRGIYTNEQITPLPLEWKKNYFYEIDPEKKALTSKIRDEIIFRRFNLMERIFPFKRKFHVIFCRNVMIYFDMKTRKELIERFYEFTEAGGYLFIGHSETINHLHTRYSYIMPAVYRKG